MNYELVTQVLKVLPREMVFNIIKYGYWVDSFHPFCYKYPESLNDYKSRAIYMEEYYRSDYSRVITSGEKVKVHDNFIIAEFEFLVRELSDKNYTTPFQYSYLQGSHEWDSFMRELLI
jgi:hypothetical protein